MLNAYLKNALLGLRIGTIKVAQDQLKLALAEANRLGDKQAKALIFRAMNYARHAPIREVVASWTLDYISPTDCDHDHEHYTWLADLEAEEFNRQTD